MIQAAGGARFLLEPPASRGIARELGRKHFDRDLSLQLRIASTVHLAHAADAQRSHNFEAPETFADQQAHDQRPARL